MFLLHALDQTIKKVKAQTANILTLMNLSLGGFAIIAVMHGELNLSLLLNRQTTPIFRLMIYEL